MKYLTQLGIRYIPEMFLEGIRTKGIHFERRKEKFGKEYIFSVYYAVMQLSISHVDVAIYYQNHRSGKLRIILMDKCCDGILSPDC